MRRFVLSLVACLSCLGLAAGAAQAVVVDMNPGALGQTSVPYGTDPSYTYGVSLVPGSRDDTPDYLAFSGVPIVTSNVSCADPAAGTEPDILTAGSWPLGGLVSPICWHSGPVMHANETFALEWEGPTPNDYWSSTKSFVQTYLSDVAAASGALSNPYSVTTQYWDGPSAQDRASNTSAFGGGCDDDGAQSTCKFGSVTGSGPGHLICTPTGGQSPCVRSDCPIGGNNDFGGSFGGGPYTIDNNICLTDADIRNEVTSLVDSDQLIKYTQPGYTPLVVVLTPPGASVCLDSAGTLCSLNGRSAPPPPIVTPTSTGGHIGTGTYQVKITYVTSGGETMPSAATAVATTADTSTLTISSPPGGTGVTGWYAYITQPGGTTFTRQPASGPPTPIGTDLPLTAALTTSGPQPPVAAGSFCSYHSWVTDPASGQPVSYVVQPWTAFTSCDEPDVPPVPSNPPPDVLEKAAGQRLVSPISQSQMAGIVNPLFTGWFGLDGLEIQDQNSCQPLNMQLDKFSIGSGSYYIQREFNNTSVVDNDPYTYFGCLPNNVLTPTFTAPTAINLGDTLDLDGSATATSLDVPAGAYQWNFGDGTTGTGPSVEHTYLAGGTYGVTLTVTDRGGNKQTATVQVQVLGANGLPAPPPSPTTTTTGPSGSTSSFNVTLRLLPQALRGVLHNGVFVRVSSNESADGVAQILISRRAARRAHIKMGRHAMIVVGTGTVSGIKSGSIQLTLRMRSALAKKLSHLGHVNLTVRLVLVGADGHHVTVDVAGHY
jgi:hypothetical protein